MPHILVVEDDAATRDLLEQYLGDYKFRVTAANVQEDSVLYNDSWTDDSWDAVWQSEVSIDDQGWTAELRIPLSQLRFIAGDHQVWGLNVERQIQRNNESIWLEMVPKSESGIASRMIDLTGLDGLKPSRRFELLPYAAARAEYITPEQFNYYGDIARRKGFLHVASGPLVRSSYHAADFHPVLRR